MSFFLHRLSHIFLCRFSYNKRTAAACMLVFLVKNGVTPTFSNDLLYNVIIGVATNAIKRAELASLLNQYSTREGV
jgi:prophage maintenance system killer protein